MSLNDIIRSLENFNLFIIVFFIGLPIIAYAIGKISGENSGKSPYNYVYSVLVYLTSVPGMFAFVLTAYTLFILRTDLREVNAVVYFFPIISMIATIAIIKKDVDLDLVPGFDRLYGLFIVLGVTFATVLMILQTRIFVIFGGSIKALILVGIVLFVLLNLGAGKLTGSRDESEPEKK